MITWFKNNKPFWIAIIVIIGYFLLQFINTFFGVRLFSLGSSGKVGYSSPTEMALPLSDSMTEIASSGMPIINSYQKDFIPQTDVANRMVVQESNLSLLVKDVVEVRNKILSYVDSKGGYMVNASTSNPQDAPTASVTIRVPASNLQETLDYFHSLSIKVVSENLIGHDVTDQFIDVDTRISQLEKTKTKFESILSQATEIDDITNLTSQILNYQSQIDSLKGQQVSLEKNSELAKITVYLSTDEIALPYAPSETFRPAVIFKLAVRSLVGSLRKIATAIIWLAVYSVILIPVIIILMFAKKYYKSWQAKNNPPQIK